MKGADDAISNDITATYCSTQVVRSVGRPPLRGMSVPVVRPRRLFVPIEITQAHVAPASAGFRDVFTVVVEFRTNVALDAPVDN